MEECKAKVTVPAPRAVIHAIAKFKSVILARSAKMAQLSRTGLCPKQDPQESRYPGLSF